MRRIARDDSVDSQRPRSQSLRPRLQISAATAALTWMALDWKEKKPTSLGLITGAAGTVAPPATRIRHLQRFGLKHIFVCVDPFWSCPGSIAGLAAITPAAGFVGVNGAFAIGFASAVICRFFSTSIKAGDLRV